MSIYFVQHNDLVKIGFSSNLPQRIAAIMTSVPGGVTFLGHMPGDRDLEAHLHGRFADSRFSGEWFAITPDLLTLIRVAANPTMPEREGRPSKVQSDTVAVRKAMAKRVRLMAVRRWPNAATQNERKELLAQALDWPLRRVRSVWDAGPYFLSPAEHTQIMKFARTAALADDWAFSESASPTPTNEATNPKDGASK